MAVANCPSCGGRIEFAIGSSVVVVCDYCRSLVARTDRGLEDLGKVAALVDTGSPLRRDLPGKYHGIGFRIVGRTQMRHQAGGIWDEWYAAFDDGRWGWLAEAQGKYYVTFKTAQSGLPPRQTIAVGGQVDGLIVYEIGTATLISGEGEIPWKVEPSSSYDYADLSGAQGRFATIDYSEETPLLFKGEETTLGELGIDLAQETRQEKKVRVEKLSCSNCGAPLNLVAPDQSERVVCPRCGGMHEVAEGNLRFLTVLKQRGPKPRIRLGTRGKIDGDEYTVAGFMVRAAILDQKYRWTEYLLFNPKQGFRWLVHSDDHWSFVRSIPAGEVDDPNRSGPRTATRIRWRGKELKIFQDAPAIVEHVLGEFYWKVSVGEKVRALDYIAPPEGISIEFSGDARTAEMNYSHGRYMPVAEVEQAFGVKNLPKPRIVGMLQPNPYGGDIGSLWAKFVIALLVIAIALAITRSRREVLSETYRFAPSAQAVAFTRPFMLSGGKNLMVEGYAEANNSWIYVGGDLVNEKGAIVDSFDLPIEYYEGYDQGERWTEGNRLRRTYLSSLPAGTYSMRLEGQWDPKMANPQVLLTVKEGIFRWSHLALAFVVLTIPAVLLGIQPMIFERSRWEESMYTQFGRLRGTEEE